jgi:N-acyl-D-amino-acid deacylase
MINLIRSTLLCAALALILQTSNLAVGQSASGMKSRVIVGGTIIDGSGRKAFVANVRIVGNRIARVGRFVTRADEEIIRAPGFIVAPGFIDIHNHSDGALASEPTLPSQLSQGITTIVVGPDGGSPWPIAEYLAKRHAHPAAVNVMTFVGHATIRLQVMGKDHQRAATDREIAEMAHLVEQGMREGAAGLSTGLEYDVGHSSTTEEVIEWRARRPATAALHEPRARRSRRRMAHQRSDPHRPRSSHPGSDLSHQAWDSRRVGTGREGYRVDKRCATQRGGRHRRLLSL